MAKSFDHKQVLRLGVQGLIPSFLLDNWKRSTGAYPLAIADTIVRVNRRVWYVILCMYAGMALLFGGLVVMVLSSGFVGTIMAIVGLLGVSGAAAMFDLVQKPLLKIERAQAEFPEKYMRLIEFFGYEIPEHLYNERETLKPEAKRILRQKALEIYELELEIHALEESARGEKEKRKMELKDAFGRDHSLVQCMGLVNVPYDSFFDSAKARAKKPENVIA